MRPKIQLILIVVVAVFFMVSGSYKTGLAACYGGLVSLLNVWLLARHTEKQKDKLASNASASVRMMFSSFLIRIGLLAVLVAIGFVVLKLDPFALVVGLTAGQIGFLLDSFKVGQNNGR